MLTEKGDMFNIRGRLRRVDMITRRKTAAERLEAENLLIMKLKSWIQSFKTYRRPLP